MSSSHAPKDPTITLPGNGLWLCCSSFLFSTTQEYDTSHMEERTVADADTVSALLRPEIGEGVRTYWWPGNDVDWMTYISGMQTQHALYNDGNTCGEYNGKFDQGFQYNDLVETTAVGGAGARAFLHMNPVSFINNRGNACSSAERIAIGTAGCRDTLPGLYRIVIESVNETTETCNVTIKQHDNSFLYTGGSFGVDVDVAHFVSLSYYDLHNPLFTDTEIVCDISDSNSNTHVIPGIDIAFGDDVYEGDHFTVGVGYLFAPRGGTTDGRWWTEHWWPQAVLGYRSGGEDIYDGGNDTIYDWPDTSIYDPASQYNLQGRFAAFNVSGELLEDVVLRVCPLVIMEQGNDLVPFSQWFFGYNYTGDVYSNTGTTFTVTFSNTGGSPKTTDMSCSGGFSVSITEVNSSTLQPTGTTHPSGTGLKCDGSTMYRWDEMMTYFVLSSSLTDLSSATVDVKEGHTAWTPTGFHTSGWTKDVGTWKAEIDSMAKHIALPLYYTYDTDYSDLTTRTVLPADSLSSDATAVRVKIEAQHSRDLYIDNVAIVERDGETANGTTTPTEFLFDTGGGAASGCNLSAGEEIYSEWLTFTFDHTKDYLLIIDFGSTASYPPHSNASTTYVSDAAGNSYDVQTMPANTEDDTLRLAISDFSVQFEGDFQGPVGYDSYTRTGKLQYQGYETELSCSGLSETKTYNYYDVFAIGMNDANSMTGSSYDGSPYGCILLLACDDPQYFQANPILIPYRSAGGLEERQLTTPEWDHPLSDAPWPAVGSHAEVARYLNGTLRESDVDAYYRLLIHEIDPSLMIRLHQVPSAVLTELASIGIEVESS